MKPSDRRLLQSYHLLGGAPTPAHSCVYLGFPGGSDGKESACNPGDPGSIPGLGRSPGDGNGNPLQYSCQEKSMDRGAWRATVPGVAKSRTRLNVLDMTEHSSVQFSSVAQLCPILCNPMDCSTPDFPVHYQLPELAQTHDHPVGDAIHPSHPLSSPSPPAFNLSQHEGLFR